MPTRRLVKAGAGLIAVLALASTLGPRGGRPAMQTQDLPRVVGLPTPVLDGDRSLESVLRARRSVREFAHAPLTLALVGQLAWAAQGVTGADGRRSAPSAGALYPLELLVVAGEVEGIDPGVYRYRPATHHLLEVHRRDVRAELGAAALGQEAVRDAPCVLVLAAVYERTTGKYGRRGERYVHMEVGHAAQNVLLQATALGLGAVMVGAFDDGDVRRTLELEPAERPLALLPVGRMR